jgi:hypothetical protein
LAKAMVTLAQDLGWKFTVLVALDAWTGWYDLAHALGVPVAAAMPEDSSAIPLLAVRAPATMARWATEAGAAAARGRGLSLALYQDRAVPPADVTGQLTDQPAHAVDLAFAVEAAQHPEGRLRGRVLA